MDRESRKKKVAHCLVDMGETITSWVAKNGLYHEIVSDKLLPKLMSGALDVSRITVPREVAE